MKSLEREVVGLKDHWRLRDTLLEPLNGSSFLAGGSLQFVVACAIDARERPTSREFEALLELRGYLPRWYLEAFILYTLPRWSETFKRPPGHLREPWLRLYRSALAAFWCYHSAAQFADKEQTLDATLGSLMVVCRVLAGASRCIGFDLEDETGAIQEIAELSGDRGLGESCRALLDSHGVSSPHRAFSWMPGFPTSEPWSWT